MSEPAFQYSDKIGYDGILVVRGDSYAEFSKNLEEISNDQEFLNDINRFRQAFGKEPVTSHEQAAAVLQQAFPAATMQPPVSTPVPQQQVQQAPPQQQWQQPQQQQPQQGPPVCQHGPRVQKSGTSKKGPWSGWMCPAKQCDPIWDSNR